MASVHTPTLELLQHDHATHTATLRVSYTLHQTAVERNLTGLRYREHIELRGADPGSDPLLFTFATSTFANSPNIHIERSRTITLADDVLDEDGFLFIDQPDEVYARVCVSPLMPTGDCSNSNEIHHSF